MEKLSKEPYDNPNLVEIYEERYIHHPNQKADINFEIAVIEKVMDYYDHESWCDVACGTGYHLRKASETFAHFFFLFPTLYCYEFDSLILNFFF